MKDAADYVCSGSNDQATINDAVQAAYPGASGLGGVVQLSPGTFNCSGAVKLRRRTSLLGAGRATILSASSGWGGGVIEPFDNGTDKVSVGFLAIDGNYQNVHGIYFNVTDNGSFDDGSPDAANFFTDLYIYAPGLDGIRFEGSRMRAANVSKIRVWNPGGYGYYLDSPDGFYTQCEVGSSGLAGFSLRSSNNRITNSKAWYSDGSGFEILAVRNQLAACESQDNEQHGFYIGAGQVSLSACHADSNSWNGAAPTTGYNGFHIKQWRSRVQLIGCQAYDKNESARGFWQQWGFFFEGDNSYCQVSGVTRDNTAGALSLGPGTTLEENSIDVIGT